MPTITRELSVLARCGNQYRSERLRDFSLTAYQAPYILHISMSPGLSQEDLAREMHVNPSNAARQLAALEESGFVTREQRQDDKRQLAVFPTQKALEACPVVRDINAQWHAYLTQDMTEEERSTLELLLEKMRRRAEAWDSIRSIDT
jgi:DNA-binding MarR family transcriptional regulator